MLIIILLLKRKYFLLKLRQKRRIISKLREINIDQIKRHNFILGNRRFLRQKINVLHNEILKLLSFIIFFFHYIMLINVFLILFMLKCKLPHVIIENSPLTHMDLLFLNLVQQWVNHALEFLFGVQMEHLIDIHQIGLELFFNY